MMFFQPMLMVSGHRMAAYGIRVVVMVIFHLDLAVKLTWLTGSTTLNVPLKKLLNIETGCLQE